MDDFFDCHVRPPIMCSIRSCTAGRKRSKGRINAIERRNEMPQKGGKCEELYFLPSFPFTLFAVSFIPISLRASAPRNSPPPPRQSHHRPRSTLCVTYRADDRRPGSRRRPRLVRRRTGGV